MSATEDSLKEAQEAARDARTKLADTFAEIKARLQPSVLVREAQEKIKEEATDLGERAVAVAREKPNTVGLTIGAIVLLLFRKPLGRLLGRVFSRRRETSDPATG